MSRGLTNQITSKELFTSNFSDRNRDVHQDSAYSSSQNTQFPYSQFAEYSQDVHSQNSAESQTEGQSMFQRYMAAAGQPRPGPSKKLPPQQPPNIQKTNYRQQFEMNKIKIKEKEEKDVLKSIANTVKSCSEEVKTILDVVECNIGEKIISSQENIGSHLKTMLDDLNNKYETLIKNMKGLEEAKQHLREIEVQFAQRDNKLHEIENSLQSLQKKQEKLMEMTVRNILEEYHTSITSELNVLKNKATQNMEDFKILKVSQDNQLMKQESCFQNFNWENQKRFQDLEKRINDSITGLQQYFDMRKYDTENVLRQQLQQIYQNQCKELESSLQQIFNRNGSFFKDLTRQIAKEQCSEAKYNQQHHLKEVKSTVRCEIAEGLGTERERLKGTIEDLQDKYQELDGVLNNGLNEEKYAKHMERLINKCQLVIRDDIRALHDRHVQEMKEIMYNQEDKYKVVEELKEQNAALNCKVNGLTKLQNQQNGTDIERSCAIDDSTQGFSNRNHYSLSNSCSQNSVFKPRGQSAFISPLHVSRHWSSKTLFSKVNPSPVATVLPQRHVTENKEVESPVLEAVANEVPNTSVINQAKPRKKRKRKRSVWSKPKINKKSGKKVNSISKGVMKNKTCPSMSSEEEEDEIAVAGYNEKTLEFFSMSQADKLSFHHSQRSVCNENTTFVLNSKDPFEFDDSRDSSPSMSMTEVIIKRRLTGKLPKPTPKLESSARKIMHKEDTMFSTHVRRSQSKRKLCDQDFDSTMVEFAQSIRQHQGKK